MKLTCNRGALLDAVSVASMAVNARTPKPILACLKLEVDASELLITATDLELTVQCRTNQVQVERHGVTLIDAEKLVSIVRESTDDTLRIEAVAEGAMVAGEDAVFKLHTMSANDYPPLMPSGEGKSFTVEAAVLARLMSQTVGVVDTSGGRYAFNAVLFVTTKGTLSLVATDGRRLAMAQGDCRGESVTGLVPARAVMVLSKLAKDHDGEVTLTVSENQIVATVGGTTMASTLVEGQFPPYEDVIPNDSDKSATVSTEAFLGAVRRAALLTTEESKGVRIEFSSKGAVLSTRDPNSGESTIHLPLKYEGEPMTIGFAPAFMIDALKAVDTDEVKFQLSAPNRPGMFVAGRYRHVIMPVNL